MKIKHAYVIATSILLASILGCVKQSEPMATSTIELFNEYEFQMPIGFNKESANSWLYDRDRTVGRIILMESNTSELEIVKAFEALEQTVLEGDYSEYQLQNVDTSAVAGARGILKQYRKNENTQSHVPVYTYHSVGLVRLDSSEITLQSFSLGFDLNSTINDVFFETQRKR